MMFDISPIGMPADEELPADLAAAIDQSVQGFESNWGPFSAMAHANGYIRAYRTEITTLVRQAYLRGKQCPA